MADDQWTNHRRVADKIGETIVAFCRERAVMVPPTFTIAELVAYVAQRHAIAPGSPDRILRALRQAKKLDYVVLSRKMSLYELTSVAAPTVSPV